MFDPYVAMRQLVSFLGRVPEHALARRAKGDVGGPRNSLAACYAIEDMVANGVEGASGLRQDHAGQAFAFFVQYPEEQVLRLDGSGSEQRGLAATVEQDLKSPFGEPIEHTVSAMVSDLLRMRKASLLWRLACAIGVLAASGSRHVATPTAQDAAVVAIEPLKGSYSSCDIVDVRVRNLSRERVSVEAYVEELKDGEWTDTACQYNLLDPEGRLTKRDWPKAIEPQRTLTIRYDRCSDYVFCYRPIFPNTDSRRLRQFLEEEDALRANAPARQRIRVEAYVAQGASLKEAGRFWSQPFARERREVAGTR